MNFAVLWVSPIVLTMFVPKNLVIRAINRVVSMEEVVEQFYVNDIAIIGKITRVPYIKHGRITVDMHIEVQEWLETETAYAFIWLLNKDNLAFVMYYNSCWTVNVDEDEPQFAVKGCSVYHNYLAKKTEYPQINPIEIENVVELNEILKQADLNNLSE